MRIWIVLVFILGAFQFSVASHRDSLVLKITGSFGEHTIKSGKLIFYKTNDYQQFKKSRISRFSYDTVFFKDGSWVLVKAITQISYWGRQEKFTLGAGAALGLITSGLLYLTFKGDTDYLPLGISGLLTGVMLGYPKRKFVIGKIWQLIVLQEINSPFIFN